MARLLIEALRRGGHAPEVACSFSSRDGKGDRARQQRLGDLGRRLARRLIARYRNRPASARPQAWFTYHLYHKAPDWLGPEISEALAIPYIVAEASHASKQAGGPWDLGYRAANDAIARADAVIGLNPNDRDGVLPLLAAPEHWVAMTPFVDTAPFSAAAAARAEHRQAWARRAGVDPAQPWLLLVGMMREGDKHRSYGVAAGVLRRLSDRSWQCLVAGTGDMEGEVRLLLENAAPGRFAWLGEVDEDDMPGLYAGCDVCLWPAVNEAYGMALVEAQAAGLPVVAGRAGGVGRVVSDRETGLLANPLDADGLACAVRDLLTEPARRDAMAARALNRAGSELDIAAAAAVLDRTLRRCAANA